MKTTFISLLTMAVMLIPACTQNIDSKTEKTILINSDKAWANAAASGDIKQISQYWTDNAINYFPSQMPASEKKLFLK
jgi:outer membrane biogenesis lipoprotein LolB